MKTKTFKRFRTKAKRFLRKRRATYRKSGVLKQVTAGIHFFKRSVNWAGENTVATNIIFSNGGSTLVFNSNRLDYSGGAAAGGTTQYSSMTYKFNVSNLPNLSEFTALFDAYKIRKVVLKMYPYQTVAGGAPANAAAASYPDFSPIMHYVIDHDDNTTPNASETGIQTLQQYPNYHRVKLTDGKRGPITIVIKPRFQMSAGVSGGGSVIGIEGKRSAWLDMADTTIDHYGLKAVFEGIPPTNFAAYCPIRCETTYYLMFKGVR